MNFFKDIYKELKSIDYSRDKLKNFGLLVGGILLIFYLVLFYYYHKNLIWLLVLSCILIFVGFLCPKLLKYLYAVWMGFAVIIGAFVSKIIFIFLFYLFLTPIGLLARLLGKDFLNQKIDNNKNTYWIKCGKKQIDIKDFEQLY